MLKRRSPLKCHSLFHARVLFIASTWRWQWSVDDAIKFCHFWKQTPFLKVFCQWATNSEAIKIGFMCVCPSVTSISSCVLLNFLVAFVFLLVFWPRRLMCLVIKCLFFLITFGTRTDISPSSAYTHHPNSFSSHVSCSNPQFHYDYLLDDTTETLQFLYIYTAIYILGVDQWCHVCTSIGMGFA